MRFGPPKFSANSTLIHSNRLSSAGVKNSMGWEVTITMKPRRETMVSSTVANVELEYQRQGQTRVMTITCHKEDGIWKLGAFG
jgi:hypothetical protein